MEEIEQAAQAEQHLHDRIEAEKSADLQSILELPALKNMYAQIDKDKDSIFTSAHQHRQEEEYALEQEVAEPQKEEEEEENLPPSEDEAESEEEVADETDEAEEDEEEEEEAEAPKTKEKKPKERQAWYLNKENRRIADENKALLDALHEKERQLEFLRRSEQESWDATIYHYEKGLATDLEQAKAALKAAREEYDVDNEIIALDKLTNTQNRLRELATHKSKATPAPIDPYYQYNQYGQPNAIPASYQPQPQYQPQAPHPQPQYPAPSYATPEPAQKAQAFNEWLAKHDVINENSRYFKPEIKKNFLAYAAKYEEDLMKKGKFDQTVFSESYFNRLDGYLEGETERLKNSPKPKSVATAHIGSAKSSSSTSTRSSNNKTEPTLNSTELMWIENSPGIDKEEFKRNLLARKKAYNASTQR